MRRGIAFFLLLLPLLWVTWGWDRSVHRDHRQILKITPMLSPARIGALAPLGPFRVDGLWRLTSPNSYFTGWSALAVMPSGAFMAFSDRNMRLRFTPPGFTGPQPPALHRTVIRRAVFARRADRSLADLDIESVVLRPEGTFWFGTEDDARLIRIAPDRHHGSFVPVPEMKDWPVNGGAEAMTIMADGRWAILCETCGPRRGGLHLGLLFPGDPGVAPPRKFGIVLPPGFDPVDMAPLPDGRLLILTRRLSYLPLHFESGLVLADLAGLDPDRPLQTRELARITQPDLRENYEGMVVQQDAAGTSVWLLSDDNGAASQQTRLIKLRLDREALGRAR